MAASGSSGAAAAPANKAPCRPAAWMPAPRGVSADGAGAGPRIMDAEFWPALATAATLPKASSLMVDSPPPPPVAGMRAAVSPPAVGNAGASSAGSGDRAAVTEPSSAHAPNHRSNAGPMNGHRQNGRFVPQPHAPNHRSNAGVPNHQNGRFEPQQHEPIHRSNAGAPNHQSGRFGPQPHGRGGHNGGSRMGIGGGIGIGNANGNGNGNGGGGRHGQVHHGGFDGHRRGRAHRDGHAPGHRQPGTQLSYLRAPHPLPSPPPPAPPAPPFPPIPAFYYGIPIGYPGMAPCYYYPPPPPETFQTHHFVPYPAMPVPMFLPHMYERQAWPPCMEEQEPAHMDEEQAGPPYMEQQKPVQQHVEEQEPAQPHADDPEKSAQLHVEEQEPAQLHVEEQEPAQRHANDPEEKLRKQIEFYFSENNLCHDLHLKRNMDDQGWVPLSLIAGFNKVKEITSHVDFILKSLLPSTEVEVQDGKIRRRVGWEKYVLSQPSQPQSSS